MKVSDIDEKSFNYLINHSRCLQETCNDLKGFYGIVADQEVHAIFPLESELESMRQNNVELTEDQWNNFQKIIQETETNIIKAKIADAKYNAECEEFNKKHPIKFDSEGYAYRDLPSYEW